MWRNLDTITEINLSDCSFSGPIPASWTSLWQLDFLDLSQNHLTGAFGDLWANEMYQLSRLDVSANKLNLTLSDVPSGWTVAPQAGLAKSLAVLPVELGSLRPAYTPVPSPERLSNQTGEAGTTEVLRPADEANTEASPPVLVLDDDYGSEQLSQIATALIASACSISVIAAVAVFLCLKHYRWQNRQQVWSMKVAPAVVTGHPAKNVLRLSSLQPLPNVNFEHLNAPLADLHEGMADDVKRHSMRVLKASFLRKASYIPCYEELEEWMYLQVPYSEAPQEMWDSTLMVSWRWGEPKPPSFQRAWSPMTNLQFAELQQYLRFDETVSFVWMDWGCVPQYSSSPMFEVARSKLFYSRARIMIVLPQFVPMPEGNMRVVLSNAIRALGRNVPGHHTQEEQVLVQAVLRQIREKGIFAKSCYFGRVWTLAERMARHGRGERLQNWMSLETWMGMTLEALWATSSTMQPGYSRPETKYFWGQLFDPQKSRATIESLRLVRELGSSLASDTLATELGQLFIEALQVWKGGAVTEALDVEWLRTYLKNEAGLLYESWNPEDAVWSIYTFFCWHTNTEFQLAHRDLCNLAEIPESESLLYHAACMATSNSVSDSGALQDGSAIPSLRRWSAPEEGSKAGGTGGPRPGMYGHSPYTLHSEDSTAPLSPEHAGHVWSSPGRSVE